MKPLFSQLSRFYASLANHDEELPDIVKTEFLGKALLPIGKGPLNRLVNENPKDFTIIPLYTLYVMN